MLVKKGMMPLSSTIFKDLIYQAPSTCSDSKASNKKRKNEIPSASPSTSTSKAEKTAPVTETKKEATVKRRGRKQFLGGKTSWLSIFWGMIRSSPTAKKLYLLGSKKTSSLTVRSYKVKRSKSTEALIRPLSWNMDKCKFILLCKKIPIKSEISKANTQLKTSNSPPLPP